MQSSPHLVVLVCLGLSNAACNRGEEPTGKQADAKQADTKQADAKQADAEVPDAAAMKEHFDQATAVRDAIIAGDLEAVAEPARWLAEQSSYASMPDPWKAHLQDMRNAGQLVLEGTDLAAKARATGQLAAACGTCHTALGQSPQWKDTSEDVAASGRSPHMLEHMQATEHLWQGLAGPSEQAWQAGVLALSDAPLTPESLVEGQSPSKEVVELATKVHELGKKGADTKETSARAELYGELLTTCADCHSALGVANVRPAG